MRQLQQTLRAFSGRSVSLRIEPKNTLLIKGNTDSLSQSDINVLKTFKPLLVLLLPDGKSYSIGLILKALTKLIEYSDVLMIDAGYDLHSADLRALPVGRAYLDNSLNN